MRITKKLVCLLVLCSLSFLLFGCWLNDDDDDQVWPVTGAIKLSAVADAGAGSFAATLRGATAAELRAAAANKFQARVKIGGGRPRFFGLDLSTDNKKLTLDATIDGVNAGKQQVTIEIVASGVADAEPILKTIATATLAAGQTNSDSITNAPINYETIAKAIAYEAWTASGSKSIDEFTPNQAALNTLAATIQTALGASIDGTKTLMMQRFKTKQKAPQKRLPKPRLQKLLSQ
ncbi:MAG: hypothetical protein PHD82_17750 [Candidatus Riflebacteria bacterium]|nr:hypothetical protein [Candidatus Riflebacteria bacterium]